MLTYKINGCQKQTIVFYITFKNLFYFFKFQQTFLKYFIICLVYYTRVYYSINCYYIIFICMVN